GVQTCALPIYPVRRRARVELREERRGALAILVAVEQQLAELTVERRVEVLRPEIREDGPKRGVREDAGERVPLPALVRVDHPDGDGRPARLGRVRPRREPGLEISREAEQVGR